MSDIAIKLSKNIHDRLYLDIVMAVFAFAVPVVTVMALYYPPVIVEQGQAHRIFYIHVPVAWVALYAPIIASVCGILYLIRREEKFDVWSLAAVRLAMVFGLGVVISGPLWAITEWGTYWNWKDSRLMSFFILLLCLGGYFLVRNLTEDHNKRAAYSSMMAIISAMAALLTWFAIRIIEPDTHPTSVLDAMSPRIGQTFWMSIIGYHFLFLLMLRMAVRHEWIVRIREYFISTGQESGN